MLDVAKLPRDLLIRVLQDGPQHLRPPRLHRQVKADLVKIIVDGCRSARYGADLCSTLHVAVQEAGLPMRMVEDTHEQQVGP